MAADGSLCRASRLYKTLCRVIAAGIRTYCRPVHQRVPRRL